MNPQSQELPNLSFEATQVAFDSVSQSIILANPSHLASYALSTQSISAQTAWSQPADQPADKSSKESTIPLNTMSLKFIPSHTKGKVNISPSGLMVTNLTAVEELVVANIGFKTGVHYWEIICPKQCKNIHVGVIQEGWTLNNPTTDNSLIQANSFKTTTPRVIGLRLDLFKGELLFWLNGNFQSHKTIKNLALGTWYPCVKIKEIGTHVILNPFAIDPDSSYPIYELQSKVPLSQIKCTLALYVIVGGFEKLEKEPVKFEEVLTFQTEEVRFPAVDTNIDESGSLVAFRFNTAIDAEKFQKANAGKKHNGKSLLILDNLRLLSCVVDVQKTNKDPKTLFPDSKTSAQYSKMIMWVIRNLANFCNNSKLPLPLTSPEDPSSLEQQAMLTSYKDLLDNVTRESKQALTAAHKVVAEVSEAPLANFSVQFISKSNTLLASQGNMLKLLHKDNGKYQVNAGTFFNRPRLPKNDVILSLSKADIATLLAQIDFKTHTELLERNKATLKAYLAVFTGIKEAFAKEKDSATVNVKVQYKYAKTFVNTLIGVLITSVKWVKALLKGTFEFLDDNTSATKPSVLDPHQETEIVMPFEGLNEPPAKEKSDKSPAKKLSKKEKDAKKDEAKSAQTQIKSTNKTLMENLVAKDLTLSQISNLLRILLSIDEALYAMTLHEDASDKIKRYWSNKKPRLFSAFARLGSLLSFPGNKYSLIELAEAGIYNTQDLLFELRHFLEPEHRVEDLQNIQEDTDLWSLLKKSLPDNQMVKGLPCENVPLSVSLNNLPPQTHSKNAEDAIMQVATHPQSSFAASVSQSGEVKLWNTEVALVNLGSTNFREDKSDDASKAPGPQQVPKKDNISPSEDNFLAGGFDLDEMKQAEAPQIQPDQGMLDTLSAMGFQVNLAKKALSLTKNVSIAVAIDKVLVLQEEEKAEKSNPSKATAAKPKQLKAWNCPACTFANNNQTKTCEICGLAAPEEAYATEEELTSRDTKTQSKETPATAEEKGKEGQEVVQKNFLEIARVHSSLLVPVKTSPLSPIVVGVVFEENKAEISKKYQLRFRRFIYSSNYVKRFLKKESDKGYASLLSGAWFGPDGKEAQNHLMEEYGLNFRALEPIFMGNSRYSEPKKEGKEALFSSELVNAGQVDLTIEASTGVLVGSAVQAGGLEDKKEVSTVFLVWNNNDKYTLQQINLYTKASENLLESAPEKPVLEIKDVTTHELAISGEFLLAEVLQDKLVIATSSQVQVFDAKQPEIQRHNQPLPFKAKSAKALDSNTIYILSPNNKSHIIELSEESFYHAGRKASVQYPLQGSTGVPNVKDLKDQDLETLRGILHKRPLEGIVNENSLVLSSNPRVQSGHPTKFFLSTGIPNSPSTFEVVFERPSSLISLELSLAFNHAPSQIISTKDAEKKLFSSLQELKKQFTEIRASQDKPSDSSVPQASREKQTSGLPTLSITEGENSGKFLPLTVSWFQGAAFNDSFSVSRVITPNNEIFCTNYANSEFLFEHLHGKTILIKSVTIYSKVKPIGSCGYPLGSGLIFTANYVSHLAIPSQFQNMTHKQYLQWYQTRSQCSEELEPWEPVGSFEFDTTSETVTIDLNTTRPCKYILLRPTGMRESFANHFATSPIEFKFFGVSGTALECPDSEGKAGRSGVSGSEEGLDSFLATKETVVQIEAETDQGEWVDIHTIRNVRVQEIIDPQQTRHFLKLQNNWEKISGVPLSGFAVQEITGEKLSQAKIGKLRVKVTQPNDSASDKWIISGVGVQAYAPAKVEALLGLEFPPATLRKVLLDSKEFEKFNKELIKELNREDISQGRKQKIMSLIADIISSENSQSALFYSHFDLKNFLMTLVLSQGTFSFRESQSLLRHFSSQKSFEKNLLDATLQILPNLATVSKVTSAGLNGFFSLLTWCQSLDPTVVFNNVLQELHNVSKKIAQLRAPEYNILRTHFGIRNLVLERDLFREGSTVPKKTSRKKSKEDVDKRKQAIPLKAKLLAYYSNEVDEYLIELSQNSQIDEIRLAFEQNSKVLRFKVQIWAVLPSSQTKESENQVEDAKEDEGANKKSSKESENKPVRKLLYSKFYNESTWIQLTNYAYDRTVNEVNYSPSEELECLGFSGLNVTARYLVVQVSYSLLPFIHPYSEKNDKKPMPEVYGRPIETTEGDIPELQKLFDTTGVTLKNTVNVKYPHTSKYQKYDVTGRAPYKHLLGAVGTFDVQDSKATGAATAGAQGDAHAPQEDVEGLKDKLKGLQTELCARINSMKPETPNTQLQDEIRNQCKEIEGLQLRLLNTRESHTEAQVAPAGFQPGQSLDYLYILAKKLSQSLRKLDSAIPEDSRNWRKDEALRGDKGRSIALDIFENLIVFDADPASKEFTGLLSEVLVHNLKPNEWQLFVITIINTFLANPDSVGQASTMGSVPPNKVFSPARIIQALDKISIPTGELLSFLTNKLNVPVGALEADKKKTRTAPAIASQAQKGASSEESSSILSTLASVLLLLNSSFKKVQPSETGELAPPGMRRSASSASKGKESPSQKPVQRVEDTNVEIKKLNHEESLQAAFYICVWICENTNFSDADKSTVLAMGLDLVLQIMKFAKVSGVRDLLRDPNSFLKLFMSTLKLSSPLLLSKFQGLLNAFLNPKQFAKKKKSTEEPGPDEEVLAEETKVLLVHHLQTILKWLLGYALNPEQSSKKEELSSSVWLEHICFILEFLLLAADKITIDPKKEPKKTMKKKFSERKKSMMTEEQRLKDFPDDLMRPAGMNRSLSFSQEGTSKSREASLINLDEFDKTTTIPLDAMNQLITLLSTKASVRQGFNLSNCTKAWTLLMKAILKIKVTALIEGKIFSSLIGSFLSCSEDIQQTMFPEIIELTQNMLKHQTYQKELCNVVLTVTFNTLNSLPDDKYDPIAFSLIKGWLDILLTKTSPKPAENYTKLPDKAFCKLNSHGALTLFVNLGSYLWNSLNLGARDGAHNCSELALTKLQIAEDLLRILVSSESMSNLLAVAELFANFQKYSKEIKKAVEFYINWFLLNRASDASGTPSTDLVKSISEDMLKLFQTISDYQEVTKVAISALISGCKELDKTLLKLQNGQRASSYTLLQYNSRTCSTLEELFDLWVTTDAIATYVAFEVKGFEYLLDRMGVSYQTPEKTPETQAQTSSLGTLGALLEGSEFLEQAPHAKEAGKVEGTLEVTGAPGTDEEPKEEEIANKLTIINLPGQTWSGITPDWSINKKGVRARILFFLMNGNFHNEYCMLFNLEKTVELKQIRIGFNTVWTDHTDKVLGIPSSVVVEGGLTQNDMSHIATLEQINDEGFSNFSVKVFHNNFQQIAKGSQKSLDESLESLSSRRVSYLKFRFRRPTVTFVEGLSLLTNKMYKNIAVSISFISIAGFDVKKLPNTRKKLMDTQENSALQVISKLCNNQFTDTLSILANEKGVINKIRSSFDNLTSLLMPHESWLAPVFLAIASHNPDMGDWIISKFLDLSRSREHAKLVGEIIIIDNDRLFERLGRLHSFVLSEIKKIQTVPSKTESLNKFNSLVPFIDVLCTTTRSVPKELVEKSSSQPHVLDFGKEDLDAIIQAFETYTTSTHNKVLIKLLILFLYAPAPFTIREQGLLKYALESLWKLIREDGKHIYYEMIGPVIIGSNSSARWFLNYVEDVVGDLISKLENFTSNELKNLRHAFILLCTISYNEIIKKKISNGGWHLKFYQALKNKSDSSERGKGLLKEIDLDMLQLAVEFLKNVCVGYPNTEEELIKVIVNDLGTLEAKKDLSFINNLFVPLLNAEADVPVCLHPYDPQSKRTITSGKQLPSSAPVLKAIQPIKSEILNKDQTDTLLKTIQSFTNASGLSRKMKDLPWELAISSKTDGENLLPSLRQKMSKQGPFFIVMEGMNAGKRCIVGAFCSQNMAELPEEFDVAIDKDYPIPMADDNFIFYYEDDFRLHFPIPSFPNQTDFGQVRTFYDGGGVLSFYYNNTERIFISLTSTQTSYVDIDLYDMKPVQEDLTQTYPNDIPAEFTFKSAEYWVLKTGPNAQQIHTQKDKKGKVNILSNVLCPSWYNANQPFNYFRATPVYSVPVSINVQKLVEIILNSDITVNSKLTQETLNPDTTVADLSEFVSNDPTTNSIIDVEFDALQYSERQLAKKETAPAVEGGEADQSLNYKPTMSIFETFERNGGVERVIELALKSLIRWKDKERSKRWFTWVQELSSFSSLPIFFGLFLKNKACMELLFQVVVGAPDSDKGPDGKVVKKWEEEEQKAVRLSYQILANVFAMNTDSKLREYAIQKQFFTRILDRIAIISKESKRRWVEDLNKKEEEEKESQSPELKEKSDSDKLKATDEEEYKKKVVKKKGVGYASDNTGQNQRWNVNEYVQSKKARNEQLQGMIEILHNFINVKEWHPPKKILTDICESALLPLLEAAFRSASLLDMAKEADLNQSYLRLTRAIAHHRSLVPCLMDLDEHYQPQQKDSIYALLGQLKELAQIFLNCLTAADKEASAPNQKLAQNIIESYKAIDSALQSSDVEDEEEDNEGEILDLLSQPLPVAYRTLLQGLRFDYVSMKDTTTAKFKHHYASCITNTTPPQQKMVRLAQELADLSTALPIEHTNSIFVRVDESRVDVMKALVMGASGTPYAHGAYEFDVYFDDAYPNLPPKVNLTTTGAGKVRFNPNLYSCGKVCLSLLGTWRGNASENWDPKLSTLLQVLVSIQAIIMSEEVYFNEPGFEGESGTEEGERKNEAYSNIVRYCNIKYAMIDQLKNPPKGFETVLRRHFYLKKEEIMEELNKWIKYAEHREASYTGLINDHNPSWCTEFKSSKTKYKDMLKTAIKELETELNKLQAPSGRDLHQKVFKRKEKKAEKTNINAGVANIEDIDMSYDKEVAHKSKGMNIEDEDVKDRWSRYIGAMGLDAVTKQAKASIFMSGLGALNVEIAKNIVLSGVNRFTIHDKAKTTYRDLSGQFFLGEEDVGKNRAQASVNKIQQLNAYVNVDTALLDQSLPKEEAELEKLFKGYTLVILSETDYETLIAVDKFCRKNKIHFITTDMYGPFARVFTDFGDEFIVVDKNGEEIQEIMISKITNEEEGVVTLLQGHTHKYEDGDEIVITGVRGMKKTGEAQPEVEIDKTKQQQPATDSINETRHKVKVINAASFKIGDTRGYTAYEGNGLAKQIKTPVFLKFQSFEESITGTIPFDTNMLMHDFLKMTHPQILHVAFEALDQFIKKNSRMPNSWDVSDSEGFLTLAQEAADKLKDYNYKEDNRFEFVIKRFAFTCQGVFSPLAAFLGGYVAQEAIKAITQKFMPTRQFFYTDCYEVIPELPENKSEWDTAIKQLGIEEKKHRSDGLRICVGEKLLRDLEYSSLFMVGAGAIGCELLKNYAMLGVGTGEANKNDRKEAGKIVLTDPDVIEVSNLTRQFLFREKHLRKPKSQTAAAAALQMNKDLKGHVVARLDKVHEGTANIFTDKFFEELTVVTNALDNVQARRYIDLRCVNAKTPLLESGTLGPKGHVQVIIPYKTESYNSQEDPKEDAEIPHCTLKMFPEETLHCVEWARDKFGKLFTIRPKGLMKVLEDPNFQVVGSQELKTLTESVVLLKKMPITFDDCIRYARIKFQKYFVNDIRQLLYTYPLDAKTKEGKPFWSLPKRPPTEITFDPTNPLHINFIAACACLRAKVFNIPMPKDARKESEKVKMANEAALVKVPDFKPSEDKAKELSSEVDKEGSKQATGEEGEDEETTVSESEELLKEFKKVSATLPKDKEGKIQCCSAEEFEKDNDQNFHIDFIAAIANCRASNYKLEPMDWMTVKIKAGRIIPALATTTAAVAGLQTIELCKLMKKCKVEDMKNAFLSLAVPIMALSEPATAPVTKLDEKLTVSIWDRWDVKLPREATLKDLFDYIEKTYELVPKDVTYGSQAIYFHALMDMHGKEKEKEKRLKSKLEELLGLEKEDKYADLNVMCAKKGDSQILKGVPPVRVILG